MKKVFEQGHLINLMFSVCFGWGFSIGNHMETFIWNRWTCSKTRPFFYLVFNYGVKPILWCVFGGNFFSSRTNCWLGTYRMVPGTGTKPHTYSTGICFELCTSTRTGAVEYKHSGVREAIWIVYIHVYIVWCVHSCNAMSTEVCYWQTCTCTFYFNCSTTRSKY